MKKIPHIPILLTLATSLLAGCGAVNNGTSPDTLQVQSSNLQTVIGTTTGDAVSFALPTRFFLVGYSHGMGTQFIQAAMAQALRAKALGGNQEQIVFIASPDVEGMSDARALEKFDIKVVFDSAATPFGASWLMRYLGNFPKIASISFFGHSSVWGLGLAEDTQRLATDLDASSLARVKGRFLPDAFVALHGCNAGGKLAPFLSKTWQVPVQGALTGTNFQRLHSNGKFYFNDEGLFPSGGWAPSNSVSFANALPCSRGACLRMKPSNGSYSGFWGTFEGGLGFYKMFCAAGVSNDACARGAAKALLMYPTTRAVHQSSSNWADISTAALDFLCPNPSNDNLRESCFTALPAAASAGGSGIYSPFRGKTLKCTLHGCDFEDTCETDSAGANIPGTCSRRAAANPSPREYVEEYRLILAGFAKLRQEVSPAPAPLFP